MTIWAIVPVKPLRDGKSRLAHILSADERAKLTTDILQRTLAVLDEVPAIYRTLVISRDPAVLKLARGKGAFTFGEGERLGLNVALSRACHIAAAQQATGVLILPADLPLISRGDVETIISSTVGSTAVRRPTVRNGATTPSTPRMIAICPDRLDQGTNALYISPPLGFNFQYGPHSFKHHLDEAERLGLQARVVHTPGLKFDLDTEEDWQTYQVLRGQSQPVR